LKFSPGAAAKYRYCRFPREPFSERRRKRHEASSARKLDLGPCLSGNCHIRLSRGRPAEATQTGLQQTLRGSSRLRSVARTIRRRGRRSSVSPSQERMRRPAATTPREIDRDSFPSLKPRVPAAAARPRNRLRLNATPSRDCTRFGLAFRGSPPPGMERAGLLSHSGEAA
jgi:hypothetical protein